MCGQGGTCPPLALKWGEGGGALSPKVQIYLPPEIKLYCKICYKEEVLNNKIGILSLSIERRHLQTLCTHELDGFAVVRRKKQKTSKQVASRDSCTEQVIHRLHLVPLKKFTHSSTLPLLFFILHAVTGVFVYNYPLCPCMHVLSALPST